MKTMNFNLVNALVLATAMAIPLLGAAFAQDISRSNAVQPDRTGQQKQAETSVHRDYAFISLEE